MDVHKSIYSWCTRRMAGLKGGYRPLGLLLATVVMVGGYALSSVFMYGTGASIAELVPKTLKKLLTSLRRDDIINKLFRERRPARRREKNFKKSVDKIFCLC